MFKLLYNYIHSHASKVMYKIFQGTLQQYVNWKLPNGQAGFRKDSASRDQIANIHWIIEKPREFQRKTSTTLLTTLKVWLCGSQQTMENASKDGNIRPPYLPPEKLAGQEATVRKGNGTTDWSKIGKDIHEGCILSACLFHSYAESVQFSSVLSCVCLFATPWTGACQASLSITNTWCLPKLMSIESVMPSNCLILCHSLLLPPSIFPSIRVFSNRSAFHKR